MHRSAGPTNPIDILRDILGIARALYVEWSPYAGSIEMDELRSVGSELRKAYQRLLKARAGTTAHTTAWREADEAPQRLGVLVNEHTSTKAIVQAVCTKLGLVRRDPPFDRDAKVRERVKRG